MIAGRFRRKASKSATGNNGVTGPKHGGQQLCASIATIWVGRVPRAVCLRTSAIRADEPCVARGAAPAGFTLIEILLVLALVAIMTALAWPMLQRPFANRRLYAAADLVRAGWCQARSEAIRSGHTFAFRYLPEGDRFMVEPESDPAGGMTDTAGTDGSMMMAEDEVTHPVETALPEGVKFVVGDASSDAAAMESSAGGATEAEAGWSEPILFYPDGTTSDARLVLGNECGSAMEVALRGLTGVVTTGDVTASGNQ